MKFEFKKLLLGVLLMLAAVSIAVGFKNGLRSLISIGSPRHSSCKGRIRISGFSTDGISKVFMLTRRRHLRRLHL